MLPSDHRCCRSCRRALDVAGLSLSSGRSAYVVLCADPGRYGLIHEYELFCTFCSLLRKLVMCGRQQYQHASFGESRPRLTRAYDSKSHHERNEVVHVSSRGITQPRNSHTIKLMLICAQQDVHCPRLQRPQGFEASAFQMLLAHATVCHQPRCPTCTSPKQP